MKGGQEPYPSLHSQEMAVEQELSWVRSHAESLTTARAAPGNHVIVHLRHISWGLESGSLESLEAFRPKPRLLSGCPESTSSSQTCCVGRGFFAFRFRSCPLTRGSFSLFLFVLLACAVFLKRKTTCNCFRCVCILWPPPQAPLFPPVSPPACFTRV